MFLYAASSFGNTFNTIAEADSTLVDYLEQRGVDWKIYATGTPGLGILLFHAPEVRVGAPPHDR